MKKKTPPKNRNLMALALHNPLFKTKVVPNKKKKQNKEIARKKVQTDHGQKR